MSFDTQQYQIKTEAPPGAFPPIVQFESDTHQPWSEPVRFLVNPRLRIAEIASGLFSPVLNPETQIIQDFESRWHYPWSEPKRFPKRLLPGLNLFNSMPFPVVPNPSNQLQGWFQEFRGPVWPKKGLRRQYQVPYTAPVRYLPTPNVTVTIRPTETNTDDIELDVWVYDEPPTPVDLTAVKVSISEIQATTGGNASIGEVE